MPRRLSKEVQEEIRDKVEEGLDCVQIETHLESLMGSGKYGFDHVPNLRTIQSIAKSLKPVDPSGPWRLMDASPDDVALIMPVLADVHLHTSGQRRYLTKREAEVICKIRRAVAASPVDSRLNDMTLFEIFKWARAYIRCEERGETTESLDLLIAHMSISWHESLAPDVPMTPQEYTKLMEGDGNARTHSKKR